MFEARCEEVRMEEWGDERELGGFKGVECKWEKNGLLGKQEKKSFLIAHVFPCKSNFLKK